MPETPSRPVTSRTPSLLCQSRSSAVLALWQARRRSVRSGELWQQAIIAPQQGNQGPDALAALRATPAGGINAAWFGRASLGGGLLHLAIGQGIAQADIHGGSSSLWRDWHRLLVSSQTSA